MKRTRCCKQCAIIFEGHWLTAYCSDSCRQEGKKLIKIEFYARNTELSKARSKARYHSNKKEISVKNAAYRDKNKSEILKRKKIYKSTTTGRAKTNASTMRRKVAKIQAVPKWLTKTQLLEIKYFYKRSKELEHETGIKHNVDHIVPILSDLVCGLHVPWNLQILTKAENMKKSNKLILE